jgi:hypothetical protein
MIFTKRKVISNSYKSQTMGWTGINTRDSFMDVFKREYAQWFYGQNPKLIKTIEVPTPNDELDDGSDAESEIFSAINDNGVIFGHVLLMKKCNNEVLYKGMDETNGPYTKAKCPKEILSLLSPVEKFEYQGYANKWRERQ